MLSKQNISFASNGDWKTHSPANCVSRVTHIRCMEIRLMFWRSSDAYLIPCQISILYAKETFSVIHWLVVNLVPFSLLVFNVYYPVWQFHSIILFTSLMMMLLLMMIVSSFLWNGLLKPPFPKLDRSYDHLNLRAMKKVIFERM